MNDDLDALEAELARLRPRSPSPELSQRIATRLSPKRDWWLLGVAAVLAFAIGFVYWPKPAPLPPSTPPVELPPVERYEAPTVWAYRSALRNTESLDELLDRHSAPMASPEPISLTPSVRLTPEQPMSPGEE